VAGLPHLRLHDLRHSCASLHLAQGTRVEVVAGILGHARPSITQDIYSHVIPTMRQDAADAIDRAFQR
jgi:integrase